MTLAYRFLGLLSSCDAASQVSCWPGSTDSTQVSCWPGSIDSTQVSCWPGSIDSYSVEKRAPLLALSRSTCDASSLTGTGGCDVIATTRTPPSSDHLSQAAAVHVARGRIAVPLANNSVAYRPVDRRPCPGIYQKNRKCPFLRRIWAPFPELIHGSLSRTDKRHLGRFSGFCRAYRRAQQADVQTDHSSMPTMRQTAMHAMPADTQETWIRVTVTSPYLVPRCRRRFRAIRFIGAARRWLRLTCKPRLPISVGGVA